MLPRDRFEEVVNSLERFYRVEMDDFSREAFYDYANSKFAIIAKFDRAVSLVMAHEPNYGRFPAFEKFGQAFSDYMKTQSGSYQAASVHLLPVPKVEEEKPDRNSLPVTTSDIERLKAKVYVCKFFKSHQSIKWANLYLQQAISEATLRNIPLDLIGASEINLPKKLTLA
jgi:hypothetical protein